ncbi:glycerol-3-phosphate dehydrogenase [Acidiphilium sp. AL]|uniref:Glycerol-3-phosphate dehydrogenase n=1 Tax=Acidiphilium iwatense TaxID=768198 RepID=A0ABS9DYE7_9PROT|nr:MULTISPECIES: glycerol-3-phosphate dehydrogenase [Acidiphilium]MCF3947133.1 glycerol-3-phosphate dehydrogenase [Acidiphilium iwatense]MCU4160616.1 glycerol-3-phosphate dehydrogenase [Acidiphilium sp. AL]
MNSDYDLVVIGGGINGAGIARDAAGRGLKTLLCEKGDFAEGTSSRSGKLVHGGLRYLEYYEFRLVREALIEREVLLRAAPHIVWPMRFVLPHSPEQRPAWMVRIGLFLYDHLGGRERLPASRALDLRRAPEGDAVKDGFPRGFEYSDCWVDDARLVVLNVLDAARRGAEVRPRTAAASARRADGVWQVTLDDHNGATETVTSRILVNAAGPWVAEVMRGVAGLNTPAKVRLVKGSHIVVKKFWKGPQAYLLQNDDKRVIFVNPYEDDLCLIGTTDIPYEGAAEDVAVEDAERRYLLRVVNRYMKVHLTEADIVSEFSGVRPLYDDLAANPSAVTRDYVFDIDHLPGEAPLLSVFGGKITTYRKLAEHALDKLRPFLNGASGAWTATASLPGGEMQNADFDEFLAALSREYPFLPMTLAHHYARLYGTRAREMLGDARGMGSLGRHFGGLLHEIEAEFLRRTEWALTAEDILLRRTKHGLHLTQAEQVEFTKWMAAS